MSLSILLVSGDISKSKMADGGSNILPRAVGFVLDNWTVLQLAIQHGFGGIDSREKAKWLQDVIVQVLTDNHKVEYDELQDYVSEILYEEFNTIVEDGSLVKISQKLCQFQKLWREGNTETIMKEIQSVEPVKVTQEKKEEGEQESSSEEMEECDMASTSEVHQVNGTCTCQSSSSICSHCSSVQEDLRNLSIAANSEEESTKTEDSLEDEEGWKVVRRSKKR